MASASDQTAGPLRIGYIVHALNVGGLERCVARLVNQLDRSRFVPVVICLDRRGDAANWIEAADARILELKKKPGNDVTAVARLAAVFRDQRIEIVHSHNWGTLVETAIGRRWSQVPVHVHAEHGTVAGATDRTSWKVRLRTQAMRWTLRTADAVVVVSEAVRHRLQDMTGFPPSQVRLIPNGVDLPWHRSDADDAQRLRRQLGVSPSDTLVGSVGRIASVKDYGSAIRALCEIAAKGLPVHLVLVGEGPERESLTMIARSLGLADRVHLVGQQLNVGAWLRAMDVYLNSSLSEGMNLSILEAMAVGLPMVVTDVGENAQMVGGNNPCGLVVCSADSGALGAALLQLITNRTLRDGFRENAVRRHIDQYGAERMVRRYEDLYSQLARDRRVRRMESR